MSDLTNRTQFMDKGQEEPHAAMEKMLLTDYLRKRGMTLAALSELPEALAKALMTEASTYASLKMAQMESAAHFRESIQRPV